MDNQAYGYGNCKRGCEIMTDILSKVVHEKDYNMNKNEMLRSLIESADDFDDANAYIEEFTQWRTSRDKLAFLSGMFEFSLVACDGDGSTEEERENFDYAAVLDAIVKDKWR